jgi:hypothetical protein
MAEQHANAASATKSAFLRQKSAMRDMKEWRKRGLLSGYPELFQAILLTHNASELQWGRDIEAGKRGCKSIRFI